MARPPIDRGEWDAVLELCRRKTETEHDRDYFYRYEVDGEGRPKNLFWADAGSVADAVAGYGDVVVLDATCRTNKHGVAFVPFLGLSHHRTPVVLGCGVTSDHSLDSLVWLLRAFMESNGQKAPASVITDGGDAVAGAVRTVFPGCSHRICAWHVERGIEEHLGGSPAAQTEFRALMFDHTLSSPAAFRDRWHGFAARHRTAANRRWLDAMYRKRAMWAAAFVHRRFFLGMAHEQRTECLATPLHGGLREGMSLPDLWWHADACTRALRGDVAALDRRAAAAVSRSRVAALTTEHRRLELLEEHAARVFTPANLHLVREGIETMGGFGVVVEAKIPTRAGDMMYRYTVVFDQCRDVVFHVSRSGDVVMCSCRKMERDGLPCRHIFCALRYASVAEIPACCALGRMTRRGGAKMERLDAMRGLGCQVFDLAAEDAQASQEIKEFFETWLEDREGGRGSGVAALEDVESHDAEDVDSSRLMRLLNYSFFLFA